MALPNSADEASGFERGRAFHGSVRVVIRAPAAPSMNLYASGFRNGSAALTVGCLGAFLAGGSGMKPSKRSIPYLDKMAKAGTIICGR